MGKVIVTAKSSNNHDLAIAGRGLMNDKKVCEFVVEGIVDTGATMVRLPREIVEKLGLEIMEERRVRYADGSKGMRQIAGGLLIEIQGRTSETRAIVQDGKNAPILIGQLPLEEMDWAVDLQAQKLIPGHEGEAKSGLIGLCAT